MDINDVYYSEAINDVNENCDKYTIHSVRPTEWGELVDDQVMYLETVSYTHLTLPTNREV